MNALLLSQRDPQWSNLTLGTSSTTIGTHGCTITAIAMRYRLTPKFVNDQMNLVNGFASSNSNNPFQPENNLVIWKKLEEALPGVTYILRGYTYDNERVSKNLPCLVEVDGAPIGGSRHWVLYIGNGKLFDPWDGQEKPTSAYQAIGYVLLGGEYKVVEALSHTPVETPQVVKSSEEVKLTDYGLDVTNKATLQVLLDTWNDVANTKKYIKADSIPVPSMDSEMMNDLTRYNEMVVLGYNSINDVNKALKDKDDTILALQSEVSKVRDRNSKLADVVKNIEEEDHKTAELGQSFIDENRELKQALVEVGKAAGVDKVTTNNIIKTVFGLKEIADKFLDRLEKEQLRRHPLIEVVPDSKPVVQHNTNWLLGLLQLFPNKKEVK